MKKGETKFVNEDDNIYIVDEFLKILTNYKFVIKSIIISTLIGIIISILIPNTYRSYSTFYPHYQNIDDKGNLKSLAGLAGINIQNENSNTIPPTLYPKLISSSKFKLEILNQKIFYQNEITSYKDYLIESNKNSFDIISSLLKIVKNTIFGEKNIIENIPFETNILKIPEEDYLLFEILDNNISIEINDEDGFIELSVFDKDPLISSLIAKKANEILQRSIIDFKLKNINDIYNFTISQFEISKKNLYKIQNNYAEFKDSNVSISSDKFYTELNRIETELNISKNIYNELALTKERTAIDVKKNTPIFTIINEVNIPNRKYYPKRLIIVIGFSILGILISSFWIIFEKKLLNLINDIKDKIN